MPIVQVLIRKHVHPSFEGDEKLTIEHDYRVDCEYQPADPGDWECPPTPEGFDIGEIYAADGVTPLALTDEQVEEIEEVLLANVHFQRDQEREEAYLSRFTD